MDDFEWLPANLLNYVCRENIASAFEKRTRLRSNGGYFIGIYALVGVIVISFSGEWERFKFIFPAAIVFLFVLVFSSRKNGTREDQDIQKLSYEWREGTLTRVVFRRRGNDYFYVDKQKCSLLPCYNHKSWSNPPRKGDEMLVIRVMGGNGRYQYYAIKKEKLLQESE